MLESADRGARSAAYHERAVRHASAARRERSRSLIIARARLATFVAMAAALVWTIGFAGGLPGTLTFLTLLIVFVVLVVLHARIEDRVEWNDALHLVCLRAQARIARRWGDLPEAAAPSGVDVDAHPYAIDLDVFGRASLFQLLGPAATPYGTRTLAQWLLNAATREQIAQRQTAVAELAPMDHWREHLAAFGIVGTNVRGESLETVLEWAGGTTPPLPAYDTIRALVYVILISMWTLIALQAFAGIASGLWAVPLIAGMILSFFTAGFVSRAFDKAGAGERTLFRYAGLFAHLESRNFHAPLLQKLRGRFDVHGQSAPAVMRSLTRILGFSNLRRGAALLHFPIQLLTLWDFHWLFALERWRRRSGAHARGWFDAAGELDALSCLAALAHDNPEWCFPAVGSDRVYRATALGHPLIEAGRRVSNDVEVGPPGTVLLVTGSNMSGKSTLLRAIGVNAVLAQCGGPACAAALQLPACDVHTSIRIQDSLERGVSYFMAALARLKRVVDAAEREPGDRVLLYLLDEILQGTNSAERGIAVQAVARHLLDAGAIGAMTTHDLNITGEEPLKSTARFVHFTETIDTAGRMHFDYRLRPGIAPSRNAIRLMKLIGIDV